MSLGIIFIANLSSGLCRTVVFGFALGLGLSSLWFLVTLAMSDMDSILWNDLKSNQTVVVTTTSFVPSLPQHVLQAAHHCRFKGFVARLVFTFLL